MLERSHFSSFVKSAHPLLLLAVGANTCQASFIVRHEQNSSEIPESLFFLGLVAHQNFNFVPIKAVWWEQQWEICFNCILFRWYNSTAVMRWNCTVRASDKVGIKRAPQKTSRIFSLFSLVHSKSPNYQITRRVEPPRWGLSEFWCFSANVYYIGHGEKSDEFSRSGRDTLRLLSQ